MYLPVEAAYEPLVGTSRMPGHYKLGVGYDTSPVYGGFASQPGVQPQRRTGNTQAWFLLDQMVVRQGPSDIDGIIVLAGFVQRPEQLGLRRTVFRRRAGSRVLAGPAARRHRTPGHPQHGEPGLGQGAVARGSPGIAHQQRRERAADDETVVELNYDVHAAQGLTFPPELQYVRHPNAQASIHSAVVFGFKAHVEF